MTTLRGLRHDDIPAHVELLAAAEAVDDEGVHYTAADLAEEYDNPDIELGRDIVGAFDGEELVGYFAVYPRPAEGQSLKVQLEGTVHPARRGTGLGTELVAAMLARADAAHAEREPANSARFVVYGLTTNTAQEAVFTAAGLRPERWTFSMRAQLATLDLGGPPPPLPAGHTLLTYTPAYDEALRTAHNEVFLDHPDFTPWDRVMWEQWVTGSRTFRPELSLVLVRDEDPGRVVAYAQHSEFEGYAKATGRRDAHVTRVGTRRELRGRGVASALLGESLRRFRAAGYDEASLHVDAQNPTGALGVYERAGFVVERRLAAYALERGPVTPG